VYIVSIKAILYTKLGGFCPPQAYFPPYITGVAPGLHPKIIQLERRLILSIEVVNY